MPSLDGVLETALYVDDLDRARGFYTDILGLPLMVQDDRMCAFAVGGRNVLLIFRRGSSLETIRVSGGTIPRGDNQDERAASIRMRMRRGRADGGRAQPDRRQSTPGGGFSESIWRS